VRTELKKSSRLIRSLLNAIAPFSGNHFFPLPASLCSSHQFSRPLKKARSGTCHVFRNLLNQHFHTWPSFNVLRLSLLLLKPAKLSESSCYNQPLIITLLKMSYFLRRVLLVTGCDSCSCISVGSKLIECNSNFKV